MSAQEFLQIILSHTHKYLLYLRNFASLVKMVMKMVMLMVMLMVVLMVRERVLVLVVMGGKMAAAAG